jgi:hypothetical protein
MKSYFALSLNSMALPKTGTFVSFDYFLKTSENYLRIELFFYIRHTMDDIRHMI